MFAAALVPEHSCIARDTYSARPCRTLVVSSAQHHVRLAPQVLNNNSRCKAFCSLSAGVSATRKTCYHATNNSPSGGCQFHEPCLLNLQEVSLIGLLAYLSYLAGDWLGLSGIVALFCCAVTISHYALHNVSSMSRVTTISAFQTLSYVSEGAIFIYVGMDTLDPLKWQVGSTCRFQTHSTGCSRACA